MDSEGKVNHMNSNYPNSNTQPNVSHFQGSSDPRNQVSVNGASITNPSFKNNIPSLGDRTEGTVNSWTGHGTDMSKMYNYGPLALNNNGTSSISYPLSVTYSLQEAVRI